MGCDGDDRGGSISTPQADNRMETGMGCGGADRGGSISTPQGDNQEYQPVRTRSGGRSTRKMQSCPENTYVAFAACVVQQ